MADRNRFSVKKKDKVEGKANDGKEKGKEKSLKKPVKNTEKPAEQPRVEEEKKNQENGGATAREVNKSEEKEDFQPIELPPFEIVTGWVFFISLILISVALLLFVKCILIC